MIFSKIPVVKFRRRLNVFYNSGLLFSCVVVVIVVDRSKLEKLDFKFPPSFGNDVINLVAI